MLCVIVFNLINYNIGVAVEAVPIKIESMNAHATAHGVTLEEAQKYIDTAKIMFEQKNHRNMYLSYDGSATILVENKRLISAYSRKDFDRSILMILEEITNV
jgi:hypothetical protein